MSNEIDFTKCKRVMGKAYNGANGKKIAIEYQGNQYMLKFPPSSDAKPTELSYTNSCISEHIASSIFNLVGVKAQETLLGNFDRHNGNWGFLYNEDESVSMIAPVFDCGSCLLPQADEIIMKKVLEDESALNARVYQFPTSAIKLNGQKMNYYDFISSMKYKECNAALERIVPKIDLIQIAGFIEKIPYISEIQKEFYIKYISARFEKILAPAYEKRP
ncbi:MAG: hypothetical protein GX567_02555 [Clostridia bacterium]|nr:hypothetical protein [Clostridia bacterium]